MRQGLSILYYKLVQLMYARGYRPKPGSLFHSEVLAKEARWMRGF